MVTQMDLVKLNGPQNKTKYHDSREDTGLEEGGLIEVGSTGEGLGQAHRLCMGLSGSGEMAQRMKHLCECEDNWYSSLRRSLGQTG